MGLRRHAQWKIHHLYSFSSMTVPHLPQHNDAVLRAPIGSDIEHAGSIAPNDPVVHLCILTNVGVHGTDQSHHRPELS